MRHIRQFSVLVGIAALAAVIPVSVAVADVAADHAATVRPLLAEFCLKCHSTEAHKGDLDLERFATIDDVKRHPKVWQGVAEQLADGEMPPKDKPQPTAEQRARLLAWTESVLDEVARARAGDPGPVVLRRLSNAEYTFTVRDLTGVPSLDPAKEFPSDSAAGEGFMNVGNALVMSPSLVTKYLDAGKAVAEHAVLLPDGIAFSPSTSQRDWTEEKLAAIRAFYARFTDNGGGSAVDLQGIKFDTKDGGVLPLRRYLTATIEEREALAAGRRTIADVASARGLNARYLGTLWTALRSSAPSLVLDPVRARWNSAGPADVAGLAAEIARWQAALWRFTQVGHIGKRDGPKAWQVPVTPLAAAREVRLKLPAPPAGSDVVTFYLAVSDAGDGDAHDFALWENPRLVGAGVPDLPLRDVRPAMAALAAYRAKVFAGTARCLAAADEAPATVDADAVARLAATHGVEPVVLAAWLDCLGIGAGETRIDRHMTSRIESAQSFDFIQGWTGADALSVTANSSAQAVRVPGNMKPRSVAVHPAPDRRVIVSWRSPVAAILRVEGKVRHAHPECGNGVTWALESRSGNARQRLAAGTAQGAKEVAFGPFEGIAVRPGDIVSVVVGPRDGNHSCDLTAVDLALTDGTRMWDLAKDVSPDILAGNPHADRLGNLGVWHFHSEPDRPGGTEPVLPAGSLLSRWRSAPDRAAKRDIADEVQDLLVRGAAGLAKDAPDAVLHRLLTSVRGPLLASILRDPRATAVPSPAAAVPGLDPLLFGRHPSGGKIDAASLCVRAPSVIEVLVPAELAEGREFVATAKLDPVLGVEGSIQMQALATRPVGRPGLSAGTAREQGGKSTWSDGERPVVSDSPVLVGDASAARQRIEAAFEEFRGLFPAALCYTKIVPVDEVVTLTLCHREDEPLRRLMLDEAQAAEIDRLWAGFHFVGQDALKLVDAFEQLWQFATQDADPSAFTPMREPIRQRAEAFKKELLDAQPRHVDAVLGFAGLAYRRPLGTTEKDDLRGLHARLRAEGIPHEQAVRLMLARVLVAPAFLYHAEKPGAGDKPGPVDAWELATRLSSFLWSSAPDAELRAVAATGKLVDPDVLAAQARRMLKDPRTRRLATEFACAWLHIYGFDELGEKSDRHFPTFAGLRGSMYEETIRFFTDLFQSDGSVMGILDADHTFLDRALAEHYGIPGFEGAGPDGWRRVEGVKKHGRGGILAQATTLAKQSGASRTSPILRGNWLCEVLLGDKLPRPPKDVPRLPEDESTGTLTMRQLTEKHSADPKCSGCHRRIDAFGFSLEGFDAIGRRRDQDLGGHPVDTRAKVMDGSEFEGLDGLRTYLTTRRSDAFLRQFCRKLLGYSLGRGVLLSDTPLVASMRDQLKSHDFRVGTAIEAIVRSKQFREIRGKDMASEE